MSKPTIVKNLIDRLACLNPNAQIAYDYWLVDDVLYRAGEIGITLSDAQAGEALGYMQSELDCNELDRQILHIAGKGRGK